MFITLLNIIASLIESSSPVSSFTFTHGNTRYTYTAYHNSNGDTDVIMEADNGFSDFWWECGTYTIVDEARIAKMIRYHLDEVMA